MNIDGVCVAFSFILHTCKLSSVFSIGSFAYEFIRKARSNLSTDSENQPILQPTKEKWTLLQSVILCVVLPIILNIIPVIYHLVSGNVIIYLDYWCWISPQFIALRIFCFYLYVILVILIFVLSVALMYKNIRIRKENNPIYFDAYLKKYMNTLMQQIFFYFLVFLVVWITSVLDRTWEIFRPPSTTLRSVQAILESLQGILFFVVLWFSTDRKLNEQES